MSDFETSKRADTTSKAEQSLDIRHLLVAPEEGYYQTVKRVVPELHNEEANKVAHEIKANMGNRDVLKVGEELPKIDTPTMVGAISRSIKPDAPNPTDQLTGKIPGPLPKSDHPFAIDWILEHKRASAAIVGGALLAGWASMRLLPVPLEATVEAPTKSELLDQLSKLNNFDQGTSRGIEKLDSEGLQTIGQISHALETRRVSNIGPIVRSFEHYPERLAQLILPAKVDLERVGLADKFDLGYSYNQREGVLSILQRKNPDSYHFTHGFNTRSWLSRIMSA